MNVNRDQILNELDKLKTAIDSVDKVISLLTLPLVEQQMTEEEKATAFRSCLELHKVVNQLKNRRVETLLAEWTQ